MKIYYVKQEIILIIIIITFSTQMKMMMGQLTGHSKRMRADQPRSQKRALGTGEVKVTHDRQHHFSPPAGLQPPEVPHEVRGKGREQVDVDVEPGEVGSAGGFEVQMADLRVGDGQPAR